MKDSKILFISFSYLNGNGGGIFATKAYINAFARLSDHVTLLYPVNDETKPDNLNPSLRMIPVYDKRSKVKKAIDYILGHVHRFSESAESLLANENFDYVVFNNSTCSYRLLEKFQRQGTKAITIHHNFQMEYVKADFKFPLKPITLFWTKRFEGNAARRSDLNLVLTRQDETLIRDYYKTEKPFEVIGVFEFRNEKLAPCNDTTLRKNTFVITGGLSDIQTEGAIRDWIGTYYPILKREVPDAHVIIAGKNPSASLSRYIEDAGIELIPSPKEMKPILDRGEYYICPIDRGGGLKLRNMDGLKNGLPVLTHKVSARGYERIEQEGFLLSYDNPKTFAVALKRMIGKDYDKAKVYDEYQRIFSSEAGIARLDYILAKNFKN